MRIAELWRYPVKSLAGESLDVSDVSLSGIAGDRVVHVRDAHGRVLTSRTTPRLLGLRGSLGADGEPHVNNHHWKSEQAQELVRAAAGKMARLVRHDGIERFDVLPLSVLTDGAVELLGVDRRRLRPNILIEGVPGLEERNWPSRRLQIADVIIAVEKVRSRCVMTTFDPDTQEQDLSVLHRIVKEFDGVMALDCYVVKGGRLAVGDVMRLLD
jgi:uncharacterized protein YcbX